MSYYQAAAYQAGKVEPKPETKAPTRKRARHPAGSEQGGEFVGDDPATTENEAFTGEA